MKLTFEQKTWIRNYELAKANGVTFDANTQEYIPFDEIPVPDWYTQYLDWYENQSVVTEDEHNTRWGKEQFKETISERLNAIQLNSTKDSSIIESAKHLGSLGGKIRAEKLSPERRSEIARMGGLAKGKHKK